MTDRVLQVLGQWLMERGRAIRDWRFVEAKVAMDVVWSTLCVCVCKGLQRTFDNLRFVERH